MTTTGVGNQRQDESVVGAVLSSYDDLPNSEKRIADYILSHRTSVASMTAREIASASGSSAATMNLCWSFQAAPGRTASVIKTGEVTFGK